MVMSRSTAVKMLVCYAPEDDSDRAALERLLAPLRRKGSVDLWSRVRLVGGAVRDLEFLEALNNADIVIFLASSDLLASDSIHNGELIPAVERSKTHGTKIISILVRPTDLVGHELANYQILPTPSKSISEYENRDKGWQVALQALRVAIESMANSISRTDMSPIEVAGKFAGTQLKSAAGDPLIPAYSRILHLLETELFPNPRRLEKVMYSILNDIGFDRVRIQKGGEKGELDIVACRTSCQTSYADVWKFESKLSTELHTFYDLAPKLIWNDGMMVFDRIVLLIPGKSLARLALLLNENPLPIKTSMLTEEGVAHLICHSSAALASLGFEAKALDGEALRFFEENSVQPDLPVILDIVHALDPPGSFDYLLRDDVVVKAYTEPEFRLNATITNRSSSSFIINSLQVLTAKYRQVTGRVLRLTKPKGVFEPLEFTFVPHPCIGSSREILGRKIWTVPSNSQETIALLLSQEGLVPGLYELVFRASGQLDRQSITLVSCRFILRVANTREDMLQLMVCGRHYDGPTEKILRLGVGEWRHLKEQVRKKHCVYLGPSNYELNHCVLDSTWVVRLPATRLRSSKAGNRSIGFDDERPSKTLLDLRIPVDEERYSDLIAIERCEGRNFWQQVMPKQLERRQTRQVEGPNQDA